MRVYIEGLDFDANHLDAYEDCFVYLYTNKNANNYQLFKVSLADPAEVKWVCFIPERDYLLDSVNLVGGNLNCRIDRTEKLNHLIQGNWSATVWVLNPHKNSK